MTKTQTRAVTAGALAVGAALLGRFVRASRAADFRGCSVIITGGSRGLGLLLARQFGSEGARVTLAARDAGELERARQDLEARGIDVSVFVCDVGIKGQAQRLVDNVIARTGRIDVLLNNAGVIQVAPLEHMTHGDFEEAMDVHFWGPLHTMSAAIPAMRRQGGGRILNVSSIGGKIAVPHLAPYSASKFALAGLSDAFRGEVAKHGIYVTTVFPGLMRTGSPFNAWFKGRHRDEFTWFAISDSLPILSIDAGRAARQIVDACRHGDSELVISWPAKLAVLASALMPDGVALATRLANRALPSATDQMGNRAHSGWQSSTEWAPSKLTTLSEQAAAENNELPLTSSAGAR
jgi:NAD(P)-dependent dehydrogenase (short-subunit alcohol dehydrogenase family)